LAGLWASATVWAEAFDGPLRVLCSKDVAFVAAFFALWGMAARLPAVPGARSPWPAHAAMILVVAVVVVTAASVLPDSWLHTQAAISRRGPVIELAWGLSAASLAAAALLRHGRRIAPMVALALVAMLLAGATARWTEAARTQAPSTDMLGATSLAVQLLPDTLDAAGRDWVVANMDFGVWNGRAALEGRAVVGVSPLSEGQVIYAIERKGPLWSVAIHPYDAEALRGTAGGMFVVLWWACLLGVGVAFCRPWLRPVAPPSPSGGPTSDVATDPPFGGAPRSRSWPES
jgi:hypothetical protein